MLAEALPLLASYASSSPVEIGPLPVGQRRVAASLDETDRFLAEIMLRHAVASAMTLRSVLTGVERGVSHTTTLVRSESRGVIRGRMDVPRYVATRATNRSMPRRYPIVVTEHSPETPENLLVRRVLIELGRQLANSPFPSDTAEHQALNAQSGWTKARLQRFPWAVIHQSYGLNRLRSETEIRIRKRQTGNEFAYIQFLHWLAEWLIEPRSLGAEGMNRVIEGILAFPTGDAFWDKVFEIWCVQQVASAAVRVGLTVLDGPRPLYDRGRGPIYRFKSGQDEVSLWFQRQRPLPSARWHYVDGIPLGGIPDLVLASDNRSPMIIDAKFRVETTETRSEETYKMLGYAENFRPSSPGGNSYHAALLFPGTGIPGRSLGGPDQGRVDLIFIDLEGDRTAALKQLDVALGSWLAA